MVQEFDMEEDFETLLREVAPKQRRWVSPGERVTGRVVFVGEQHANIDLGDGLDALLDLAGIVGKSGQNKLKAGDRVDAYVLRIRDRVVELTVALGKGQQNNEMLQEAVGSGVPVTGTVTAVNKGGYVVDLGGIQGFCPMGQIDVRRIEDPNTMIGQKLQFRVTDLRGRDATLSRRALMEAEREQKARQTREQLTVGALVSGTVTAVRDFGAFVDLGGLEGFVPASELGWQRVRPSDVVQAGQTVEVQVLRIEPSLDAKGRPIEKIALSMKAVGRDPFETVRDHLTPGIVLQGTVTRVEMFGAFVEIIPGVEGLVHVSAFGKRVARPSDLAQVGKTAVVSVLGIDPIQRRLALSWIAEEQLEELLDSDAGIPHNPTAARVIGVLKARTVSPRASQESLALAPSAPRAAQPPKVGSLHEVTVDKVETFGVFVSFAGHRGLVPNGELGLPFGTDGRRVYPPGTRFVAVVQEVRGDGKIRLSLKGAQDAEERAQAQEFMAQQPARPTGAAIGSLGELLLKKFGPTGTIRK